ncbi:MAG TPA: hypothetical protein VK427_16100 [Kofleriaceae bacterium]|nr:hypothetical protein [Kofleriaceae bacterium]
MRMLLSLLLVSSSAFAATKVDPVGATEVQLKGNVLVWHDAVLYAEPAETAKTLQLATFDAARKDRVGHVVVMKVVSGKGAFVEVELAGDAGCTWSRTVVPDDLARVRMFVRRADIAPVLVKSFAKTFEDGTSITLGPGTPVVATDAGTHVVSLRGDEVELAIPAGSVGFAYVPGKSASVLAGGGQTIAVAASTPAQLAGRTVPLTAWKAAPITKRGDAAVVALEDRCMAATVIVPAASLAELDESTLDVGTSDGGGASMLSLRDDHYLPRLTPLSIGEHAVAVAAKPIFLHAEPSGKHACIQRAIKIESALPVNATDAKLRVCAPAASVAREGRRTVRPSSETAQR